MEVEKSDQLTDQQNQSYEECLTMGSNYTAHVLKSVSISVIISV